jgi:tetratricopeptide (TPR) repeat protein
MLVAHAHQLAGQAAIGQRQWALAEVQLHTSRTILQTMRQARAEGTAEAAGGQYHALLPELLAALGLVRCQQGALPRATELCQHAVDVAQRLELPFPLAAALLALAEVRLIQGQAAEAAQAAREGAELARTVSPRLLAQLLIKKAEALLYDGRFPDALATLQMAAGLLAVMDDGLTRLQLYLVWGVEQCLGTGDWEAALANLDKARAQLAALQKTGGTAVPESVALRLGLARIALHTRQFSQAAALMAAAEQEAAVHGLVWQRPVLAYWQGMVHRALGDGAAAEQAWRAGVTAVSHGGCPDDLPLLLLRLGQLMPPEDRRRWEYLERCVTAVYGRARHADRLLCLQEAGRLLLEAPDTRLRRIGSGCLAAV